MSALVITGWKEGLKKVSLTRLIRAYTGYGLTQGKRCVDDLLEGKTVVLSELTREKAEQLAPEVRGLGAVCHIETVETALAGQS